MTLTEQNNFLSKLSFFSFIIALLTLILTAITFGVAHETIVEDVEDNAHTADNKTAADFSDFFLWLMLFFIMSHITALLLRFRNSCMETREHASLLDSSPAQAQGLSVTKLNKGIAYTGGLTLGIVVLLSAVTAGNIETLEFYSRFFVIPPAAACVTLRKRRSKYILAFSFLHLNF